jgi:hypothetical protein
MRRLRPFVATLSLVILASSALQPWAAPAPRVRPHPSPAPPASFAARSPAPEAFPAARADLCASRPEGAIEALGAHVARALIEPLPTPHSYDAGGIAVLEDDGTFFFQDGQGHTLLDVAAAAQAFYRTHGDDYDAVAFYLATGLTTWLGSPGALAASFLVRNDTDGIGLLRFDLGQAFGSPARLHTLLSMNGLHRYPADPYTDDGWGLNALDVLGHEIGHRWSAFTYVDSAGTLTPAILGREEAHWNFFADVAASLMDGCDWVQVGPDSFRTVGRYERFFPLDQYLMGLREAAEVDSFFVVNDWHSADPLGNYVPASSPIVGLGLRGRATWWDIDDVLRANGPRVPDVAASPKAFRTAVCLVVARGTDAAAADLAKLDTLRTRFSPWWEAATEGRSTMDVTLASRAGQVTIEHAPLPDTEDPLAPRPILARVRMTGGGLPVAIDPASVRVSWRAQGAPAWAEVALGPDGGDLFSGVLPAPGAPGAYEYVIHAASDSAGLEAADPPAGPAAPHVFVVGPDGTPPWLVHAAVTTSAPAQLPRTLLARAGDNLGVDSVWAEWSVDGGPIQSAPAVAAGGDSFLVALGAGLAEGQSLAYLFGARDASAAGNIGPPDPAWRTLLVGPHWVEDFENGPAGWTHASLTPTYRDAWRTSRRWASPAGGTGWACGLESGLVYPARLDAALESPEIPAILPGTFLRFDHRYDLEERDATRAWDGARVEGQVGGGAWQVLPPAAGYSHTVFSSSLPLGQGTPCWSGRSSGFLSEAVDLSPLAPGPARIRFRMTTDDWIGGAGWDVDHVRIDAPAGPPTGVPAPAALALGRPWPNPTRGSLRLSLALPRAAEVEWALYDVAGRRVATLARATLGPGSHALDASPRVPASGLYFARLALDGRVVQDARVALLR